MQIEATRPNPYLKYELAFFITYCYLFPILTDLEYSLHETSNPTSFVNDIPNRLLYGTFQLLAFWVFYKVVLRFLFKKQVATFFALVVLYLLLYHVYFKLIYYFVGHADWFGKTLSNQARSYFKQTWTFSIIYMLMQFLALGAMAYFIRFIEQEKQMRELKEQQLLSELTYLKAQLQPHFFFNTLNNIYSLALQQSKHTAPLIARLSDMMRYILYEANQKTVPLQKEITFFNNYVEVEKIRHPAETEITFDVQGIELMGTIEPLLLLPFIENAFKHGIEEEVGTGYVKIIICKTENELILEVSNSRPKSTDAYLPGIGLVNVKKRLDLLYGQNYRWDIMQDETTYQVNLTLNNA